MTDPIDDRPLQPTSAPDETGEPAPATPLGAPGSGPAPGAPKHTPGFADDGAPPASSPAAEPERPATAWREPPWFPPRDTKKARGPSVAALVFGLILIAVGLYFFIDRTLGVDLPRIQWSTIWPVILIVIGAVVLFRSVSRRS